eukprot:symbB.v1.2.026520.t2/scaffold2657.1/size73794/4
MIQTTSLTREKTKAVTVLDTVDPEPLWMWDLLPRLTISLSFCPVIIFMEPHCVVSRQWLEPLLEQLALAKDHKTLVMPTLDIIPENNFNQYLPANHHIGGFDWTLTFGWKDLIEKRNSSYVYPDPYPTPALSGGIFGIWKDNWEQMGTYDINMTEWGGEHIEMSLRTWRCGGRILIVPCSRMGHVFRAWASQLLQKGKESIHCPRARGDEKYEASCSCLAG